MVRHTYASYSPQDGVTVTIAAERWQRGRWGRIARRIGRGARSLKPMPELETANATPRLPLQHPQHDRTDEVNDGES